MAVSHSLLVPQLREPLVKSVALLPGLLEKSSEIGLGSFNLKLQQTAMAAGDPELGQLVQGLSARAIDVLMNTGRSYHTVPGSSPSDRMFVSLSDTVTIQALRELEDKALLKFEQPWEPYFAFVKALPLEPLQTSNDRQAFRFRRAPSESELARLKAQQYLSES